MMKISIPFLIVAACACAQPKLTLNTTSAVFPGATIVVSVSLSGSVGSNLAIFGFTLPAGASGLVSSVAGKYPYVGTLSADGGSTNAVIEGYNTADGTVNDTAYSDGPVATFNYVVPAGSGNGVISVNLGNALAASTTGTGVGITVVPLNSTVGVSPACASALTAALNSALGSLNQTIINLIGFDLNAAMTGGTCQ